MFEVIHPAQAKIYLAKSRENRKISERTVIAFADMIRRRQWIASNQGIGFDDEGYLFDGGHRLHAIILANEPAECLVVRGLPKEAITVVDKGRGRQLSDDLFMLRGVKAAKHRVSYANVAAELLARTAVVIKTVEVYDRWCRFIGDGVNFSCDTLAGNPLTCFSAIGGAFALAYRYDPTMIALLGEQLRDGTGLKADQPLQTLRHYLERRALTNRGRGVSYSAAADSRMIIARKVLRALQLEIEGVKSLKRLEDTPAGLEFFCAAYDTKAVKALLAPWKELADPPKEP